MKSTEIVKNYKINISNNEWINSHIIIKDLDYKPNPKYTKEIICKVCGEIYKVSPLATSIKYPICFKHHFYYICDYCHKEFEIKYLGDFVQSNKKERLCSHNCSLQYRNRTPEMINYVVQMNKSRVNKNLNKIQICFKCGKEFKSIFPMNICNGCITSNTNKNNLKIDQICQKCGKVFHSTFIMNIGPCCNPNAGGTPLFTEKDGVLYYKDIEWKIYKSQFKTQNINFKLPEGFRLYPTFRIQDSEDWSGARTAFEQSLVDDNITWFVYIKFDENNNPLVVGKSDSLLVNKNGSDVNFSEDINDGPSRKYLQEESLKWNKAQIAIKKCISEQEAYILEKEIGNKYNLFYS